MLQINGDSTPKIYSQVFGSRRYSATAPGLVLPSKHFNFTWNKNDEIKQRTVNKKNA